MSVIGKISFKLLAKPDILCGCFAKTSFVIIKEQTIIAKEASIGNMPAVDRPVKPDMANACQNAVTLNTVKNIENTISPGFRIKFSSLLISRIPPSHTLVSYAFKKCRPTQKQGGKDIYNVSYLARIMPSVSGFTFAAPVS